MNVTLSDEAERLLNRRLQSGEYESASEVLEEALRALETFGERVRLGCPSTSEPSHAPRPVWEMIVDQTSDVPLDDWATLPTDGASQVDHYIYGLPKRRQQ